MKFTWVSANRNIGADAVHIENHEKKVILIKIKKKKEGNTDQEEEDELGNVDFQDSESRIWKIA